MTATKKQLALWAGLKNRKERDESGLFLAEGRKLVTEVVAAGWPIEALLAAEGTPEADAGWSLTPDQMSRVSGFRSSPEVIAVVQRPLTFAPPRWKPGSLALVLDGLQDPGNVGTLIRTAAWFAFDAVFHSAATADPFGPKAVQASMGAVLRVRVGCIDEAWWAGLPPDTPILGTALTGEPVFETSLPSEGLLILGNEGHGIGTALESRMTRRLTVPRFGSAVESLNVASAGAIIMAELRRGAR